ncbi:TPA: hypothetical protein ACNGY6_005282, partial [Klebsiella variicola subsp. variicola]
MTGTTRRSWRAITRRQELTFFCWLHFFYSSWWLFWLCRLWWRWCCRYEWCTTSFNLNLEVRE